MFYLTLMSTLLTGDFVWWLWADLRLRELRKPRGWRIALAMFTLMQIGYMLRILIWPFVPRHELNPILRFGFCFTYPWHLLVMPLLLLTLGVHWIWTHVGPQASSLQKQNSSVQAGSPRSEIPNSGMTRRQVLVAVPPLLAVVGSGVSVGELFRFRIRRMTLPIASLPAGLDGMTLSIVSDTHVGRFTTDRLLDEIAAASNALNADITLFAGDLIDVALADLEPALRFAKKLRSPFGVYLCEGNHDLIEDGSNKTHEFERRTKAAGLNLLCDEAASVVVRDNPVRVIGARWSRSAEERTSRTQGLMQLRDPDAFNILLTHHPHAWDDSTTPLTICGHTHGGQLMLTERMGIGPVMFRYWSGLYQNQGRSLIVTNGTGNWFPVRTMAPAEIIHLTLRRATDFLVPSPGTPGEG